MTKSVVTIQAFLILASTVVHADYASEVMADGPEAYYRFEESAGATSLADSSGNGHDSLAASNVVLGARGAIGKAGIFSNANVRIDLQLSPAAGDFSIEALACFHVTDVNRTIVNQESGTGQGRHLLYRTGGGNLRTYLGGSGTTSSSAPSQDEWHHIVMTVEDGGAIDTIRFYVDGQAAGSGTETVEDATGDWMLGKSMIGLLDELAIYTNRLGDQRISDHYAALTPTPSGTTSSFTGDGQAHSNLQPYLTLNHIVALEGEYPQVGGGNSGNTMIGEMTLFAGTFAPDGWAFADGQLLDIAQNTTLFSLVGTTYGGDGRTTFALPDMQGRTAIHPGQGPGLPPWTLGQRAGEEHVTLSKSQMPAHSHTLSTTTYRSGTSGGSASHNNMQPSLVTTHMIATDSSLFPLPSAGNQNGPTVLGEIRRFAGSFAFDGMAKLDGQLLSIADPANTALFGLLEATYGGDGVSTFALPDLRGRTPVGFSTDYGHAFVYRGDSVGTQSATLTTNQLPRHIHEWSGSAGEWISDTTGGNQPHSAVQPSLGLGYIIALRGNIPTSDGSGFDEHFVGEVSLFAGSMPPNGWAMANGDLLNVSVYPDLFDVIGTRYGGDGVTTFALPDLRERVAIHLGQVDDGPNHTLGERGGEQLTTLTESEMPAHDHSFSGIATPAHYVSKHGAAMTPYSTWFTAAKNIQDAVDEASLIDMIWVDDGEYSAGGTNGSRVHLRSGLTLQSVNGPAHTSIVGEGPIGALAVRCVLLDGNTVLSGFTLTNGFSAFDGAGVYCSNTTSTITNCILTSNSAGRDGGGSYGGLFTYCKIIGNSAVGDGGGACDGTLTHCTISDNSAGFGGGSHGGILTHCTLSDNSADSGGGCSGGTLTNCVLTGNWANWSAGGSSAGAKLTYCTLTGNSTAGQGGGTRDCTLYNCIVWSNSASSWPDRNWSEDYIYYSCTEPDPMGPGDITANPLFLNEATRDFRLGYASPCIDAGTNIPGVVSDHHGAPRPFDGNFDGTPRPDMGAFEYDPAATDTDGDGMSDGTEYVLGFHPALNSSNAIAYGEIQGQNSVVADPAAYGLYTADSIMDLDLGYLMLQVSNGWMRMSLQLEQCTNLVQGVWNNAGAAVLWTLPATSNRAFFRVRGR